MDHKYQKLVAEAAAYHDQQQMILQQKFGLGTFERYDVDLAIGRITFSRGGRVCLIGSCWPAGSLSHLSDTWLWAWANLHYPPAMRGFSKRARRLGRSHGYRELADRKWDATQEDAWRVTSILELLGKTEGAYRCPGEDVDQFLVLRHLGWAG